MAGDLNIQEGISFGTATAAPAAEGTDRIVHHYGRVGIVQRGQDAGGPPLRPASALSVAELDGLSETERLGVEALRLRESDAYLNSKQNRPRAGESWDMPGCTTAVPPPHDLAAAVASAAGPTSGYLEGSIAVGVIVVQGPADDLVFSQAERRKIITEVQEGLGWYAAAAPQAGLEFHYDFHFVTIPTAPDPNAADDDKEKLWRDPALAALGYAAGGTGVSAYVEYLRATLGTRWTYCAFFTKYPVKHFAYAQVTGPYLVMDYANDGWGVDNIDTVFAHETGHIFGAPDEYRDSGCTCGGHFGRYDVPNSNCENCAPGGSVSCLMRGNGYGFCAFTPAHLGIWLDTPLINRGSDKVADIAGGATGDGTTALQWPFHGGNNQLFRLESVGGGYVRVMARHSGKVLTVQGGSTADGAPVVEWVWDAADHQRFFPDAYAGGDLRLSAKHSGKVLDVSGGSRDDGAPLVQNEWTGDGSQRWTHRGTAIAARHSGKVIDISGGSSADGTHAVQWTYHVGDNQLFLIEKLPDGYVRLVVKGSAKVLDVAGGSTDDGAQVLQWPWHGGDNQRFLMQDTDDKQLRFVAKHSGKVLDVTGGSGDNGAQIIQWTWHGGQNQRWQLL